MNVGHSTLDKWGRKLKAEREVSLTAGKPITEEQREIAEINYSAASDRVSKQPKLLGSVAKNIHFP